MLSDEQVARWWPDMGRLIAALRAAGAPGLADRLVVAVEASSTSDEILGGVGVALRDDRALRATLDDAGASAWDAVMSDVRKAFPGLERGHRSIKITPR